jgi:hypothetical protein
VLAVQRFDHAVLADRQAHALAGFVKMVAEVVVAGQPEAAFHHRQLTAEASELLCVARRKAQQAVTIELRIHHQSPGWVMQSSSVCSR